MSEPKSRVQRWPLPQSAPVIAEAARRRAVWLEAMRKVSQSQWSETERSEREELGLDNGATEDYD